jgi:flagellar biosynthesis regulator FlaF
MYEFAYNEVIEDSRQTMRARERGRQQELVFRSARAAQAQSVEPEDPLQVSEEHLNLLSLAA